MNRSANRLGECLLSWCTELVVSLSLFALGFSGGVEAGEMVEGNDGGTAQLIEVTGAVEQLSGEGSIWLAVTNGQMLATGSRLRTSGGSRATVQFSDRSVIRLGDSAVLEIRPPRNREVRRFRLWEGILYFFNRERPGSIEFETPLATGSIRGTEFVLETSRDHARTTLSLVDGAVSFAAAGGSVEMVSGERVEVGAGGRLEKSRLVEVDSVMQWALYYPAVANVGELQLTPEEAGELGAVQEAWREGRLLRAFELARGKSSGSEEGLLLLAAVDLAGGQVEEASVRLGNVAGDSEMGRALREMILVVRGMPIGVEDLSEPGSASMWLARSYTLQANFDIEGAREAARAAVSAADGWGQAYIRLAELNFALGEVGAAYRDLDMGLELSPWLAAGWSLRGFMLLELDRGGDALEMFDYALALDPALATAWLGRGLSLAMLGRSDDSMLSLQAAAAMDPLRSLHRSYLAKYYMRHNEWGLAEKEIAMAKRLDPNDPTAWLYAAFLESRRLRPNKALEDLKGSIDRNDNRRLFRSRLQLDQDRAVRGAYIAGLYRDAGLEEVGRVSATRALSEDVANYSAHLFASQSMGLMEDPRAYDLRYESARLSELLVANLLAPPGAGHLSQTLAQQENMRFFEGRPVGLSAWTEYASSGDWRHRSSAFGSLEGFSYALDMGYDSISGEGEDDWSRLRSVSVQMKQRVTTSDEVYVQVGAREVERGDVARYYDPGLAKEGFAASEQQLPALYAGWHHAWAPNSHTLFLYGYIEDDLRLQDPEATVLFLRQSDGRTQSVSTAPFFGLDYEGDFLVHSAELQHLWQGENQALILGGRYQHGETDTWAGLDRALTGLVTAQRIREPMERLNGYIQFQHDASDALQLVGGIGYDHVLHALNNDAAPLSEGTTERGMLTPRAGVLWNSWRGGLWRAAYSRSLGGMYFDGSMRLEPSQVAGFTQVYRSLAAESVVGVVPGTEFESYDLAYDQELDSGWYLGVGAGWHLSDGDRLVGVLTNSLPLPLPDSASSSRELVEYDEKVVSAYVLKTIGEGMTLGVRYKLSHSRLETAFPEIPDQALGLAGLERDETSVLQETAISWRYQHSGGLFGGWESVWYQQENRGFEPGREDEGFWQHQAVLGYRLPGRSAEVALHMMNLTDQDYRLSPLNYYRPLWRGRTFLCSFRLNF